MQSHSSSCYASQFVVVLIVPCPALLKQKPDLALENFDIGY